MSDDKKPRASTHGDARDRRRRTPPQGYPVEIDPELTPPPQEMPPLPDNESIPPPIKEQLEMLSDGLGQVTRAIGKVWDARKDGDRLDRIEVNLAAIAKSVTIHETLLDQYLKPQLDHWRATTDEVARQLPKILGAIEAMTLTVGALDRRVYQLELELRLTIERFSSQQQAESSRTDALATASADLHLRLTALERAERDREVTTKALSRRDRAKRAGFAGAIATVVSVIAAAIASAFK